MNAADLTDSITFIVADDANVLCFVNLQDLNVVTLPTTRVNPSFDWKAIIDKEISDLIGTNVFMAPPRLYRITRTWIPPGNQYIVNMAMLIKVTPRFKTFYTIPTTGRFAGLKWLNTRDLSKFYNLHIVGSPILIDIFPKLRAELETAYHQNFPSAIQVCGSYMELNGQSFGRNTGNATLDDFIEESSLKNSKELIYVDFLKNSYPDILMSGGIFTRVVVKLGFNRQECANLFRAADLTTRGHITFGEYFGIVAALEPGAKHVGTCGVARATYIFRYLNKANNGQLTLKELQDLAIMLRKSKQMSVDAASLDKDLRELAALLGVSPSRSITMDAFVRKAKDLSLRSIGNIIRSTKSITTFVSLPASPSKISKIETVAPTKAALIPASIERSVNSNVHWEVGMHTTRITNKETEFIIEPIINSNIIPKSELDDAGMTLTNRRKSLENLSARNVCNELIELTRKLVQINDIKSGNRGRKNREYTWGTVNRITFSQKLISVCNIVIDVFNNEPRLLNVTTPVYILGDFHGNFGDLLYFEKMLWQLSPLYNPAATLFLGDYVDRGWYSIELISYLFASKVLHPKKFFLLRGNHEIRDVQQIFTFHTECVTKFGDQQGRLIWENINSCFDYMPIAAVVDGQLFCCHGGIPPPWLCTTIEAINKIPKPLSHPEIKSPLAWELLWNDPIRDNDISKDVEIELSANSGFAANQKRGTAHVFNYEATQHFLNTHNFTHIIRAHELAMSGFSIFHQGKLISVFSSSRYNGNSNEAACLLAENFILKVIRLNPGGI